MIGYVRAGLHRLDARVGRARVAVVARRRRLLAAMHGHGSEELGQRIRRLRLARNMSQRDLAEASRMAVKTIMILEQRPTRGLQSRHIISLAGALGITTDQLLGLAPCA